ncbi:IucA/IucC family protein [Acinetobacter colistiniresistens]|uniref:Siderophore biosynthesis protein n=1 Tax=Acinetobacter colistiniresistens TaxID=280145 RepID=A0A558F216_9GAMM|nr:IucA/IucC family protein [Acinetobacter colistiniresistens]TVT79602.1 siderophore biosynthesis protein [Acinetobacter colistiniresistens]
MNTIMTDAWSYKLFEQYLNTFYRERQVNLEDHLVPSENSPLSPLYSASSNSLYFSYAFNASGIILHGAIQHLSTTGYHRYQKAFIVANTQKSTLHSLTDPKELVKIITDELRVLATDRKQNKNIYAEIINSIENTRFFLDNKTPEMVSNAGTCFQSTEQGMLYGHPFHVTSKANLGFSKEDMKKYSPELGTAFQLHYFAVHSSLIQKLVSDTQASDQIESEVRHNAKLILKEKIEEYELMPTHPWQANFLLQHPALKRYLDQHDVVYLGALGQTVWPTSSVRTVWLPQSHLFLKLSIDVRITSFIRNNPMDEMERAIDASKIIIKHEINDQYKNMVILPELEAKTVKIPELESSFGILFRAGLPSETLENTRMLGGLVEENDDRRIPLSSFIDQAAQTQGLQAPYSKFFLLDWWKQYIRVSLIPLIELFANKGISVEAHLQNSLMEFKQGYPYRLILRDMEGISIVPEMLNDDTSVSEDSTVWFSQKDAWIFLQYYLVINHIAHLISAIARVTTVEEVELWQTTRHTLIQDKFSVKGKYYRDLLLNSLTLPIKANMMNTLYHSGGNPIWIEIENPLYKYRGAQTLSPLHMTKQSDYHIQAENRVISQLLEALIFEHAFTYEFSNGQIKFYISETLFYTCSAKQHFSFKRIKLNPLTLVRHDISLGSATSATLKILLADLKNIIDADPIKWQSFSDELNLTYVKHAQTLSRTPSQPLRHLSYLEQEARINNAHLYHPSFKSRIGFDLNENQKYSPELSEGFKVKWVATHRSLCKLVLSESINLNQLYHQHFSEKDLKTIQAELTANNVDFDDYILSPIHPWQWHKIIELYYQDAITSQQIIPLSILGPTYLPQQSIRTLSNITDISALSLKLAMNLVNTSTSRVLAPHTVQNAAKMSDWLYKIVAQDQVLESQRKPVILREIAGLSINQPIALPVQYGALACIWRESIYSYLKEGESATPVTGLMQLDTDQEPLIDDWIREYGIEFWLEKLFSNAYLPIMHILWCHGLALESHAQNMVLIHKNGLPIKAALKDFHDGIRFSRHLLREPELLPDLQDAPQEHAKINPNSFLETHSANELRDFTQDALWFVNLAELAIFLNTHYGFDEVKFWTMLRSIINQHKEDHPEFAERYELFNFTDDTIDIEQLASRRFLPEIRLRVQTTPNPLSLIQEMEYE